MGDVNIPHAAAGLVVSESKELGVNDSIRGAVALPATREHYRYLAEMTDTVNSLCNSVEMIETVLADIEARLVAGGL